MYKVLYVDDEPNLLELGRIFLNKHWGYLVNTAISADEALIQLKTENYDAIVSDYEMPGMDGISFLKYLRGEEFTEPFILFTGKGREEVVIEALNNGADYYLQKGGDPTSQFSELVNMINRAVEKKRTEEELERANLWSSTIINHLPYPTFVVDPKGKIISWNLAMEKLTGLTAEMALGRAADDAFYETYGKNKVSLIYPVLNPENDIHEFHYRIGYDGKTITGETRVTDKSGKERFLWSKASPLHDKNMEITGVIETIQDITKNRQLEIELRESTKKFQTIINFIPDPTFVIDNQGKVIAWNHALEILTGTKADSMIGSGEHQYSIPLYGKHRPILIDSIFEDNPQIKTFYEYVKKVDNTFIAETCIRKLSGREDVYIWVTAAPLYDTNGNLTGAIESIRDVTSRKELELELKQRYEELAGSYEEIAAQNEEIKASFSEMAERELQLAKSERKFRSLIEHIPDGIIISHKGKIKYMNPKAIMILGYDDPRELEGTRAINIVHPDRRENLSEKLIISTSSLNNFIKEIFLKKDGTEIPVEVAEIFVTIEDSKSTMTIFRDISKECGRKTALSQVRKKLDILASITQHDIRNQVQVLGSTLDLISDEELPEHISALVKRAVISSQSILNSLRINTEYQALGVQEPRWFFVRKLVNQAALLSKISNNLLYLGSDIEIYADPLIGKVFENLIDNSIRHGGDFNKITINTDTLSGDLLLIYEDDGEGIEDNEKERIFKEGYGKNTGLGLFLIKEILSVTGITIRECGRFGKGALFEMRIPHGKWRFFP